MSHSRHEAGFNAPYLWLAVLLAGHLQSRGWSVSDLNRALGKAASHPTAFRWLRGLALPSTQNVLALSRLLGVPKAALLSDHPIDSPLEDSPQTNAITTRAVQTFDFSIRADGTARIRLDLTLTIEQATPLIRVLMDANLVVSSQP